MSMKLRQLEAADKAAVQELFGVCFAQDAYYCRLLDDTENMGCTFAESLAYCLGNGLSRGVFDGQQLVAFALLLDYGQTRREQPNMFDEIFGRAPGQPKSYEEALHQRIQALEGQVLYLLSLAVAPAYRRQGLAAGLVDTVLEAYPRCHLVADVSNEASLSLYRRRNFRLETLQPGYFYVEHRQNTALSTVKFSGSVRVLVPDPALLVRWECSFEAEGTVLLPGYTVHDSAGIPGFYAQADDVCTAHRVRLDYPTLLRLQRRLNPAQVRECFAGDTVFYAQLRPYAQPPLLNAALSAMLPARRAEWSLIPDVYVSVPMQYEQLPASAADTEPSNGTRLLENMAFRTYYEAGVPSQVARVDDLASFKQRIERRYLGRVRLQILAEVTPEDYLTPSEGIGPPAEVELFLSVDRASRCAVLTWFSLSCPFLVSHLFDNVISNRAVVITDGGEAVNFYNYIEERYGCIRRGTPKIFAVFPADRHTLTDSQMASLLACETIYPAGENFGKIIDRDIVAAVESPQGMGQYDRAFVCAYRNAVLQFSEDFSGSIRERLCEESITLFYVELILFEEAAIHMADRGIVKLFSSEDARDPVAFLAQADAIYDAYAGTIDFWDAKVNYPTSQKSIAMLREAFAIREQLEDMWRNQKQLKTVFETKSDLIDRKDSKRMDISLAVLSLLTVFSAWNDSYDYLTKWAGTLPDAVIFLLQRGMFALVLLMVGYYACTQLLGGRRKKRKARKKQNDRKKQNNRKSRCTGKKRQRR